MSQNILQLLVNAVKQKRCVAVRYRDQNQVRVLEPHAIYTDDSGEIVVDAFQTRGYSAAGRPVPFWRPFRVKKIGALSILNEGFSPRYDEGFSPSKLKYKHGFVAMVEDGGETAAKPLSVIAAVASTGAAPKAAPVYAFMSAQDMGPVLPKNPHRR